MSPRLFLDIMSVEARKRMSYRVDFWINTLFGFLAEFGVHFFLAVALFAESGASDIRGFARPDLVVYFVTVLLIQKIVIGPDFGGHVSEDIYEGGLTRYLLFPAPYVPFKYAQHLGALLPLVLQALLFGLLAVFLLEPTQSLHVTPWTIAGAIVCVLVANLLFFLMRLSLQYVAFWQDNVWSLSVMLRFASRLLGGAMLPLTFFPAWSADVLRVLPFRALYDLPTQTFLGQLSPLEWITGLATALAWCGVFMLLARAVWKRGELQYTGVGI